LPSWRIASREWAPTSATNARYAPSTAGLSRSCEIARATSLEPAAPVPASTSRGSACSAAATRRVAPAGPGPVSKNVPP
jgi:hypothetical protein